MVQGTVVLGLNSSLTDTAPPNMNGVAAALRARLATSGTQCEGRDV